ncbi:MAG: alcohol dehydrogenase catalytic domain-containing protein [Phycisphaerae bacterium]|nr:alcohol dehydrogenase catalytic domain-containing protein [Phycisphaerae bacterium]
MKAAYLTGIREVQVGDWPEPKLQNDTDVLLQVEILGVCGSDMHYYRTGRIGEMVVEYPYLVGHEFSAKVLDVGAKVTNVKVAQRVTVDPLMYCGQCDQCRKGREHTCRNQKFLGCPGQADGCLCERIVMPAECCFPVPDNVTAQQAALLEPFCIGLYARTLAGDVAGKTVAILGAGPIGLCVYQACRAAGVGKVYMTDIRPERVEFAERYGADWVGNPETRDVVADIQAVEPNGVDVVFEAAGEQAAIDQGVELLSPGGMLLLIGIPEVDRVSMHISTIRRKELTIQNVRRQNHCVPAAIELLATGKIDLDPMVTHTFTLDETKQAFDIAADYKDNVIKAMIEVSR